MVPDLSVITYTKMVTAVIELNTTLENNTSTEYASLAATKFIRCQIRKFLSVRSATTLVLSFTLSHVGHCIALLSDCPLEAISKQFKMVLLVWC